jgi:hypothetical protein
VDFSKLSRNDWLVAGGGLLLAIDLIALPWFSVTIGGFSATSAGTGAPDGIFGVLAFILALLIAADLLLERFSPETQLPTTPLGRQMTRFAAAAVAAVFLIIKFLDHTSNFGFGFYLAVILTIVVLVGTWLSAQGSSATA